MTAQDRGWGPAPTPRRAIVQLEVGGVGFPGGVHREIAPLVAALVRDLERETDEQSVDGWCWGYAPRKVRGSSTTWSNHAWGLAIDWNAPAHPMGKHNTFEPAQRQACRRVAARYGFRWGGDYRGRPDDMHFEFMGTPADAAARVRALEGDVDDHDQAEEVDNMKRGDKSRDVAKLQVRLTQAGHPTDADGDYGPATEKAVRAFQSKHGLEVTGTASLMTVVHLQAVAHGVGSHAPA